MDVMYFDYLVSDGEITEKNINSEYFLFNSMEVSYKSSNFAEDKRENLCCH